MLAGNEEIVNPIITEKKRNQARGFSMVELLVATIVLVTGILGGGLMIMMGMARDNANRVDTTATNAAQTVLEQLASVPANANPSISITDCAATNSLNTAAGGAPLTSSGDIDFSQNVVSGYQVNYTLCNNNGTQVVYDVRWNISGIQNQGFGKLITVSAQQYFVANQTGIGGIRPVTLRTVSGE